MKMYPDYKGYRTISNRSAWLYIKGIGGNPRGLDFQPYSTYAPSDILLLIFGRSLISIGPY
uniref:Putative unclassified retrotransposon protein n=1 Tax=Oryza sativa subsp. indica TaxID=39946 RepID=C5NNU4_ORYSI|nr:putative unclassified retrotransposon protein [Oryza sativa Indica Group]